MRQDLRDARRRRRHFDRHLSRGVMTHKTFLKSGHTPTLISALMYFDVSFMVWVILGPLAPFLRQQFGMSATQQGLLVAIPLLGGSLFRPVLGVLADRIGGRRAGLFGLTLTLVA